MVLLTKIHGTLLLTLVSLLVGCIEHDHGNQMPNDSTIRETYRTDDSLRNEMHYKYLADLATRKVGELILSDSIHPADNEITSRCIDSLNCKSQADRYFYFKVFTKILAKADGAVGETVAERAFAFVQNNPAEFAKYIQRQSDADLITWATGIASEFAVDYENGAKQAVAKWMQKLTVSCALCDSADLETLTRLGKSVTERSVN